MASSTTIPIASTKPNMVSVFMVKPSGIKKQKVPKIETGMAKTGISVDLKFCRNKNTTSATNPSVSSSVTTTSLMETLTTVTASKGTVYSKSDGKNFFSCANWS